MTIITFYSYSALQDLISFNNIKDSIAIILKDTTEMKGSYHPDKNTKKGRHTKIKKILVCLPFLIYYQSRWLGFFSTHIKI